MGQNVVVKIGVQGLTGGTSAIGAKTIVQTLTYVSEPTVITIAHGLASTPRFAVIADSTGQELSIIPKCDATNIVFNISETYTNAIITIIA